MHCCWSPWWSSESIVDHATSENGTYEILINQSGMGHPPNLPHSNNQLISVVQFKAT